METVTDLSGLAGAVDFATVTPALFAVAGALIGVSVIIFGIKKVRGMLGSK